MDKNFAVESGEMTLDDLLHNGSDQDDDCGGTVFEWEVDRINTSLFDSLKPFIQPDTLLAKLGKLCVPQTLPKINSHWSKDFMLKHPGKIPVSALMIKKKAKTKPAEAAHENLFLRGPTLRLAPVLRENLGHYKRHRFTDFHHITPTPISNNATSGKSMENYFIENPYSLFLTMLPPQLVDDLITHSDRFRKDLEPDNTTNWSYKRFFTLVELFFMGVIEGKSFMNRLFDGGEYITRPQWVDLQHSLQFNQHTVGDSVQEEHKLDWSTSLALVAQRWHAHTTRVIQGHFFCADEGRAQWQGVGSESKHGNSDPLFNRDKPITWGVEFKQLHEVATYVLINFALNAKLTWEHVLEENQDVLGEDPMRSIIQIYKLIQPLLPHSFIVARYPKTVTCDAGFGNAPLAKFAIENDFDIVANVKQQFAAVPKALIDALSVDKNDYLVLKTTNTFTSNSTRVKIKKPVFLTISNVFVKSSILHTFPSSTAYEYVVYAKEGRPDKTGHQDWTKSPVPSAVAYYLNTYRPNDIHNSIRAYSDIESLWRTRWFKVRVFLLLLNYVFTNTYCIWFWLVKKTKKTPVRSTFLKKLRAGLRYVKPQ